MLLLVNDSFSYEFLIVFYMILEEWKKHGKNMKIAISAGILFRKTNIKNK